MHRGKTMWKHGDDTVYKPKDSWGYQKLGERHAADPPAQPSFTLLLDFKSVDLWNNEFIYLSITFPQLCAIWLLASRPSPVSRGIYFKYFLFLHQWWWLELDKRLTVSHINIIDLWPLSFHRICLKVWGLISQAGDCGLDSACKWLLFACTKFY